MTEFGGSGEVRVEVDGEGNKNVHVAHPEGNQKAPDGSTHFEFTQEQLSAPTDISGCHYLTKKAKEDLAAAQALSNEAIDGMGAGLMRLAWVKGLELVASSMLKGTANITDGENRIDIAQARTNRAAEAVAYLGLGNHSNEFFQAVPGQINQLNEGFGTIQEFVAGYNIELDAIAKRVLACSEDLEALQKRGAAFADDHGKNFVQEFHPPMQGLNRLEGIL